MSETAWEGKVVHRAEVRMNDAMAGYLEGDGKGSWCFRYAPGYAGQPVSLTLPVREASYPFAAFPAVFEGLLPEGLQLEALLRTHKIDRHDNFRQLITVGQDLVGAISVQEIAADDGDEEAHE